MKASSNRVLGSFRRWLWIATTPVALTFLLASPARAQHGSDAPAEAAAQEAAGQAEQVGTAAGSDERGGEHALAPGEHAGEEEEYESLEDHPPPHNPIQNFAGLHYGKDTEGGKYEPEKGDHKMPAPFLGALFNFAVVAFLVGKYGGPAIRKMVTDRHDEVAKQLEESTRLREEAKAKLDEYNQKLAQLDSDINKLVEGIRNEAEHDKQRIVAEATQRAERMKKEAEQTIAAEIARVKAQLEREVTLTAIAVAEKLLTEKTTDADQRKLNEQFIGALAGARTPRA
jgi:F-type H+-transporting ATPase subunit b